MAKSLIPLRPEGFIYSLSQDEMDCLSYYVITHCGRQKAFLAFARPDLLASGSKPAIEDAIKQFFASKEVKKYIEDYITTLEEFLHPKPKAEDQKEKTSEEQIAEAREKLLEFAVEISRNIKNAEDPEAVLKIADKLGLLGSKEQEVVPQRFLGEVCSECRYRKFIEENCEEV